MVMAHIVHRFATSYTLPDSKLTKIAGIGIQSLSFSPFDSIFIFVWFLFERFMEIKILQTRIRIHNNVTYVPCISRYTLHLLTVFSQAEWYDRMRIYRIRRNSHRLWKLRKIYECVRKHRHVSYRIYDVVVVVVVAVDVGANIILFDFYSNAGCQQYRFGYVSRNAYWKPTRYQFSLYTHMFEFDLYIFHAFKSISISK